MQVLRVDNLVVILQWGERLGRLEWCVLNRMDSPTSIPRVLQVARPAVPRSRPSMGHAQPMRRRRRGPPAVLPRWLLLVPCSRLSG